MADYPLGIDGQGKHGGRVRYLEDLNGDGRYDKSTLFLDGLGYPSGVWPWRKGVLISCAPEILYAEDTDGDGRADRRETLYQGFSEGNQQHRVNGFSYGLDNWLYGANGDSGGKIKSLKTGEEVSISGRDFRIRPDEGRIEAQAGQSQFGRHRDDWGNWFGNNNSNPMWHYTLEDHYLRRNPHVAAPDGRVMVSQTPGASPVYPRSRTLERFNDFNKANRFTSACSAIIYRDDLFGPEFIGNSFVSEPVHNLVHREIVEAKGTTFTSRRAADELQSEFLASSDNWFRPTMVQTGPDGALWVADMYRHVIEHPQWIPPEWQKRLDLRAGHDKGRIYRVYPKGHPPRPIVRLDKLSTSELVAALDSPSGWQRDMVQQLLIERADKSAVPDLRQLAEHAMRPQARLQALCALDGLNALNEPALWVGLGDTHPGVRRHAIRLSEPVLRNSPEVVGRSKNTLATVANLIDDPDPRVQMQLAYSLGEFAEADRSRVVAAILLRPDLDRFLRAAALSSVKESNLELILRWVIDHHTGEPPPELLKTLLGLAASYKNEPSLILGLDLIATPRDGKYAAWQVAALTGLLDALDREKFSLNKLGQQSGGKLATALARVAAMFEYSRITIARSDAPESERLLAAWLMGRGPDRRQEDIQALGKLLAPQTPGALQAAVVDALGRLDDKHVPAVLLANWKAHGPQLRARILDALAARPAGQQALLDALQRGDVKAADIDAARRQQLLARLKGELRAKAETLLAGSVDSNRRQVVESYQSVLSLSGNAEQGAAVFKKSCAACHKLSEAGYAVGPDLTALNDRSPAYLLTHVLDPNRAVEARYLSYTLIATDGRTFTGMLASETSTSVTLLAQENKQQVVLRGEIEELAASGKSLMPEGVEKDISPQAMADLLAFLATLGPPRKQFAGNKPEVVEPFNDGSLRLFATQCEIYGRTVVFEEKYRNLGYWSSENDQAIWTMHVTQPGRYTVTIDYACDDGVAGNALLIELGDQRLSSQVAGTGSWDNYRRVKVGELDLTAGTHRLTFRSQGPIRGALLDLRDVKLAPAEK
jgi:putative membrane-bound dehydrogenase-like protein